ncbi:MAG: hypothetical protein KF878_34915 [Planctomycetes bacterium]|nr:hypothetical protein [Planctomycetota bacterium]MCW8140555.1 hypothetical protein [Planctomycetota bacterium]
MTTDLNDDLVFISREDLEHERRERERAWSELLAEAAGWPTIRLDD